MDSSEFAPMSVSKPSILPPYLNAAPPSNIGSASWPTSLAAATTTNGWSLIALSAAESLPPYPSPSLTFSLKLFRALVTPGISRSLLRVSSDWPNCTNALYLPTSPVWLAAVPRSAICSPKSPAVVEINCLIVSA